MITTRAYHALFMQNMLVMPTKEEFAEFHPPDFIIYNAGCFPANKYTTGVSSCWSFIGTLFRGVESHFGFPSFWKRRDGDSWDTICWRDEKRDFNVDDVFDAIEGMPTITLLLQCGRERRCHAFLWIIWHRENRPSQQIRDDD